MKISMRCIGCLLLVVLCAGCKLASIKYSMTGASISPEVKTFSVDYFPNKALLVYPPLSDEFTQKLKDYLTSNTNLQEVTDNNGDIRFEGQIIGYSQKPVDIQRDEVAANNRLTIEIRVKYTNIKDDKFDFDTRFSHYKDYSIEADFTSEEGNYVNEIIEKIVEDIYNKALVNW